MPDLAVCGRSRLQRIAEPTDLVPQCLAALCLYGIAEPRRMPARQPITNLVQRGWWRVVVVLLVVIETRPVFWIAVRWCPIESAIAFNFGYSSFNHLLRNEIAKLAADLITRFVWAAPDIDVSPFATGAGGRYPRLPCGRTAL